jgi:hypothetical protein
MDKIILSSEALKKRLEEFCYDAVNMPFEDYFVVLVECTDKKLSFGGYYDKSIEVESQSDWRVAVKIGQLRNVCRVLKQVEEQPITMTFENDNRFIEIFSIIF